MAYYFQDDKMSKGFLLALAKLEAIDQEKVNRGNEHININGKRSLDHKTIPDDNKRQRIKKSMG